MKPIFLDFRDTTEALRASRSTIYRLIKAGHLRPVKLGKSTRFRLEEVEAFAANLSNAGGRDNG